MKLNVVRTTAALAAVTLSMALASAANAAYVVTFAQVGAKVVATGDGAFNFSGLTFNGFDLAYVAAVNPSAGYFAAGNLDGNGNVVGYSDLFSPISGPTSFGTGGLTLASSTSGTVAGISGGTGQVILPGAYPINGALTASVTTWNNATIASLGLTPGTYTWTWSSDSFTINIAGVPEPTSWAMMIGGFGFVGGSLRRRQTRVLA